MAIAAATADPITMLGITWIGSPAANGIAPSVIPIMPIAMAARPASRSSSLHSFLRMSVASPITHGGFDLAAAGSGQPSGREKERGGCMKIVAVTACPTGIAHTYMAAARLEKVAKNFGHEIKVETQGAMGIENKLTETDIRQAHIAIFAVDIEVEGRERFNGVKVIQVPLQEALKNPENIFSGIHR